MNSAPIVVDGRTNGVLGIAHDITEQKQERERAARADKLRALGQLASGVAHDFNNSLAAILGRAQLILRRVKDEDLIRSLGIIVTAAEDAATTVRRIQTFARKSPEAELELLDIGGLLRDAIEITRTRWLLSAPSASVIVLANVATMPTDRSSISWPFKTFMLWGLVERVRQPAAVVGVADCGTAAANSLPPPSPLRGSVP